MPERDGRGNNRFDTLRLLAAWLILFSHYYPLGSRAARGCEHARFQS